MADETTQPRIPLKEAVSIIWLAQRDFRTESDYKIFCDAVRGIPWDFTDERFLAQIEELKQRMIPRLELDNEETLKKVAEEVRSNTVSKDELEVLDKGLEETQGQRSAHHKKAHEFTKGAVNNYVKSLKEARGADFTIEKESAIRNSAAQAVQLSLDTGDVSHIKNALSPLTNTPIEIPPEIQDSISKAPRLSETTEAVLTSGDDLQKGSFLEQCLTNLEIDPKIIASKNRGGLQTEKIFSLSDEVKTHIDADLEDGTRRQAAFRQASTNVKQGISQPLNDIVTAVGGPQGKQFISSVIDSVLGTSIEEVKTDGAIGGQIIKPNAWTQEKIQQMEHSLTQSKNSQESVQKIAKPLYRQETVRDAAGLWRQQVQRGLVFYLESASVKASSYAPEYFHYFILAGTDVWNAILGRATRRVVVEATKKAGASLLKKGGEGVVLKTAALATGNPIVMFLATAGSKVLSFVGGAIKGFASFFGFGEIAKGITLGAGGGGQKKQWWNDLSWIVAIGSVVGILILSGFTFIRETSSTAAIVAEKEEDQNASLGRGAPHGNLAGNAAWNAEVARAKNLQRKKQNPVDYCDSHTTSPMCQPVSCPTCACPVVSSDPNKIPYITQGPDGSYSHESSNAIDVSLPMQSQVLSPENGTVTGYTNEYEDGSGFAGSSDGGGYGNHVIITTPEGNTLMVAHLAYDSMPALGSSVSVGQQIGRIGQTGNSSGPHLHIGYTNPGAPNIGSLFPTDTPIPVGCASSAECGHIEACGTQP